MGDIKVFNDAGLNDLPSTITSYDGRVARISTFIDSLEQLTTSVDNNTQAVQNMVTDASPELDSFKEVADNINIEDFLAGLGGST